MKKHRHHSHNLLTPAQEDTIYDDPSRDIMYRLYDSSLAGQMSYQDFQSFFRFSWIFQNYDSNGDEVLDDIEMMNGMKN